MKISDIAKKMIIITVVIGLICIVGSVIYYRSLDFLPFMYGVLIGTSVSIFKIFLLERAIDKALTMEKNHAGRYISLQHLLRLLLSGAVLVIGAVVPGISLWGVAAGILAFQISVYGVKFSSK